MANQAVWGIDIGQCALKALRCRHSEGDDWRIEAVAFDYIEYPQILSQPDANPEDLVRDALKQFLSRNSVRGDKVVVSVTGQSGLARFIKLPPVESKKIPDIVKYEARQQIPFPLEDVIWDYQQMGSGSVEEGFALETEVGLFAMKRDQVYKVLKPFDDAGIEVDIIQLTPSALYNYIVFDQLRDMPTADEYDPDNPPESVVVLSAGTDTTDLVITNGFRVWQRSIPVGGNHFTKALTKDMKLGFATAEHLKRNAAKAEDPKALFQAMRPVFGDLLTELQRSIGYFSNMDRRAKIGRIVALGNVMKLPGLQKYLAQNLGFDVTRVESYRGLTGQAVVGAPAFKENLLSFGVCFGLCLQGLGEATVRTNLLPPEITEQRMIRAKKPWTVAAAAVLLMGLGISYFAYWRAWDSAKLDNFFRPKIAAAEQLVAESRRYEDDFNQAKNTFAKTHEVGQSFLQNVQGRQLWLEFMRAVNLCLPRNPEGDNPKEDVSQREEIKISSFDCYRVERLEDWYAGVARYMDKQPQSGTAPREPAETSGDGVSVADSPGQDATESDTGPQGPGWVVQFEAHHYRNWDNDRLNQGIQYVRDALMKNLNMDRVPIPLSERQEGGPTDFPVKEIGIRYPVLIEKGPIQNYTVVVEDPEAAGSGPDETGKGPPTREVQLKRYDFRVQFCWQEVLPGHRAQGGAATQDSASRENAATPADGAAQSAVR